MTKIWITGDKHGYAQDMANVILQCKDATSQDYLIICGDFGAEYGKYVMGGLKKVCKTFPGKIIVLRGNHDECYWKKHTIENTKDISLQTPEDGWKFVSEESYYPHFIYQQKYPNILYTRDEGDIISLGGYKFLFIPGAYSVDKFYRLAYDLPYNPKEQLTDVEKVNLIDLIEEWLMYNKIDFVISHTFPLSWEKYYKDLFLTDINQSTVDKKTEKFLDKIKKILNNKYIHWFGGHFHDDRELNEKATMLYNKVVEIGDYIER